MPMQNVATIRFDDEDRQKLEQAAADYGVSVHHMVRLIVQNYLNGWQGPYVVRRPIEGLTSG